MSAFDAVTQKNETILLADFQARSIARFDIFHRELRSCKHSAKVHASLSGSQ